MSLASIYNTIESDAFVRIYLTYPDTSTATMYFRKSDGWEPFRVRDPGPQPTGDLHYQISDPEALKKIQKLWDLDFETKPLLKPFWVGRPRHQ